MPVEIRDQQLRALLIHLEKIANPSLIKAALNKSGEIGVNEAKRLVPVRTGHLRDSISFNMKSDNEGALTATMPYAVFVEFGTRKMRAQPYLEPGAIKASFALEDMIEELIKTGDIKGVGGNVNNIYFSSYEDKIPSKGGPFNKKRPRRKSIK